MLSDTMIVRAVQQALDTTDVRGGISSHVEALLKSVDAFEPPIRVERLFATLGVSSVIYRDIGFDGALVPLTDRKYKIFLSSRTYKPRARFSLAHELGHILIHRLVPETRRFATRNVLIPPGHESEERLCDLFASQILMPDKLMRKFCINRPLSVPLIRDVSQHFAVSLAAAARRVAEIAEVELGFFRLKVPVSTDAPPCIQSIIAWAFQRGPRPVRERPIKDRDLLDRAISSPTVCEGQIWLPSRRGRFQRMAQLLSVPSGNSEAVLLGLIRSKKDLALNVTVAAPCFDPSEDVMASNEAAQ